MHRPGRKIFSEPLPKCAVHDKNGFRKLLETHLIPGWPAELESISSRKPVRVEIDAMKEMEPFGKRVTITLNCFIVSTNDICEFSAP